MHFNIILLDFIASFYKQIYLPFTGSLFATIIIFLFRFPKVLVLGGEVASVLWVRQVPGT